MFKIENSLAVKNKRRCWQLGSCNYGFTQIHVRGSEMSLKRAFENISKCVVFFIYKNKHAVEYLCEKHAYLIAYLDFALFWAVNEESSWIENLTLSRSDTCTLDTRLQVLIRLFVRVSRVTYVSHQIKKT